MKGIMFNTKYGLEQAVLRGDKTRTWRADAKPRYEVGEIVAIKQSYRTILYDDKEYAKKIGILNKWNNLYCHWVEHAGWDNKMFVKNELMPHRIRITAVRQCKLQDITEDECLREGIDSYKQGNDTYYNCQGIYIRGHMGVLKPFKTAKDAFFMLINKLNGWGYWWNNPEGYAYEFELVK